MTRHRWNYDLEKRIAACDSQDGNGRTERLCTKCGITKITVHPPIGYPWHEWKSKDGELWQGELTPPCIARSEPSIASESTVEVITV